MTIIFPSYKPLFELVKRRLRELKKIAINRTGKFEDQDSFLFLLIGNFNLRLNTMCFLMENDIIDGVYAMQRTIFEIQLAFEAYSHSEEKDKFLELYFKKRDFESANKWDKLVQGEDEENPQFFSNDEKEIIATFKKDSCEQLSKSTNGRPTKLWYELASGRSIKELSNVFLSSMDYFASYDEPSNWVHPQRLEKSIDTEFNQRIDKGYCTLLIGVLMSDVKWLSSDFLYITQYLKISKGNLLFKFGEKLKEYNAMLQATVSGEDSGVKPA